MNRRLVVHMIVAVDRRGAIGRGGDLLYRLRADLRRFKAITTGNTIVMGRRTWESLPGALPGRRNIVVTRNAAYRAEDAETAPDLDTALAMAAQGPGDTYIIGGAQIYAAAAHVADVLDLTVVHDIAPEPDTHLVPVDLDAFAVTAIEPADTLPPADFVTLHRK